MLHVLFDIIMCTIFVIGIILIGEARQKRPDHPACRRCEYNLSGLPGTTERCPECGGRLGRRGVIRPREPFTNNLILWTGIVIVALSLPGCCLGEAILTSLVGAP